MNVAPRPLTRRPGALGRAVLGCALAVSFVAGPAALAQDSSAAVTLTDDMRPNPLIFRGTIAAPVALKDVGVPLNRNNDKCRYLEYAKTSAVPQVILTLEKPKRVSLQGIPEVAQNPGGYVVSADRRAHYCVDSLSRPTDFNLAAGVWHIYFVPRHIRGEYSFRLRDETRPASVVEPPQGLPTMTVEPSFKPNPLLLRPELAPPGKPVKDVVFEVRCGDEGKFSETPSALLEVKEDRSERPLTIRSNQDFVVFDVTKGRWMCVSGRGTRVPLSVGKHPVHIALSNRHGSLQAKAPWFTMHDEKRALQYVIAPKPENTLTLPATFDKPVSKAGVSAAPRAEHPLVRDNCRALPAEPDFYLRTSAPLEEARVQLLGSTGNLRLVGPLDDDGSLKVAANASREARASGRRCLQGNERGRGGFRASSPSRMNLDGLYAVFVTGEGSAPAPYALRVFGEKTPLEPLARAAEPAADLPLEERVLSLWYPDLHLDGGRQTPEGLEQRHRFWMDVPRQLLVFLQRDLDGGFAAGTPLVVLSWASDVRVMAQNGRTLQVKPKDLAATPPGAVAAAQTQDFEPSQSDLPKWLSEKAAATFLAKQTKFTKCYNKVLDKLDPDGNAGRYDIVTYRRGRVVKVEGLAAKNRRIAGGKCGEKAYDRYVDKLIKKVAATQAKEASARAEQVRERVQGLFAK